MNQLEALKQINNLTSAILSNFDCITLKEYVDSNYIPFQENAKKEKNFKGLLGKLNIITSYEFMNYNINQITENDIVNFFNILQADRKIKQSTLNRYRTCLNHIFNMAINDKVIIDNPVRYTKKYKEISRDRALNSDEIQALLKACKDSRNQELYYIVLVALYTGMRYSNIINMKKSNIINNMYLLPGSETKSGKGQTIPLHHDLLIELNNYMQEYNIVDNLFKTKRVKRSFKTALKKAGIENFRFHDLRRTFATMLKDKNVDIVTISKLLGHSSIMMTQIYLASNFEKELDSINKICFS